MCACTMTEHLCERGEKLGCLMFPEHATVSVQRAKRIFQVLLLYMCHEDSEVHGVRESSTTTSAPYLSNEGTRMTFNTTQTEYPLAVYCKPPCLICYIETCASHNRIHQTNKWTKRSIIQQGVWSYQCVQSHCLFSKSDHAIVQNSCNLIRPRIKAKKGHYM